MIKKGRFSRRRTILIAGLIALFWLAKVAHAATGDIGHLDQSWSGAGTTGPTESKPESKLWWNDGYWWACMFDTVSQRFHIFKLNVTTQAWTDTGVAIDDRSSSRADALWDGAHLYVASHVFTESGSTAGNPGRLYRFSYNPSLTSYSLDSGFPVAINNYSTETLVIDKDSTGKLWATWTQGSQVWVNRTTGSDQSWGTPFVPSVSGTSVDADDISAVIAFDSNKIGVMWSNQKASAMYFAVHRDGQPDTTWDASRTAVQGPYSSDDHINLKSIQCDMTGRVYAAVKTSMNDSGGSTSSPLIVLMVRDPSTGDWASYPFGRVSDSMTRPLVVIDHEHDVIHMFATAPESGGSIYEKTSPTSPIAFPVGAGTPVIRDAASADMNDATSTKQCVDGTTGLVVLASNEATKRYWHSYVSLATGPAANFQGSPTSGAAPLAVTFTDTSTGAPTSWSWSFGDGGSSTLQNPSHTYQAPGTYTVSLTASNASGSNTLTRSGYIAASGPPPTASFQGSPTSGPVPLTVAFTDTSTGGATGWSWSFGDGGTSTTQNPTHVYQIPGTYTVVLTASNGGGSNTFTRSNYIVVDGVPPTAGFQGSPTSGPAPLAVAFTDTSTGGPTSWSWTFGDGGTSALRNPSHTYQSAGTYTVSLTATNAYGSNASTRSGYISVSPPPITFLPVADAYVGSTAPDTNYGTAVELKVRGQHKDTAYTYLLFNVTGLSKPPISAKLRIYALRSGSDGGGVYTTAAGWTESGITWRNAPAIGGSALSSAGSVTANTWVELSLRGSITGNGTYGLALKTSNQNDIRYSSREGSFPAQLVVTPSAGSSGAPVASFQGTPTSGTAPLAVAFTDTSTGSPASWAWTFGDGGTSALQNPGHTYQSAGTYTVALTATNANGSNTLSKSSYITVNGSGPTASFQGTPTSGTVPLAVSFTDTSTGSPASWAWTFGDGGTSALQNPGHTYQNAGTYTVALTASNANGSNTLSKSSYITVNGPGPTASFQGTPTSGTAPLAVAFTDTSTGSPASWAWTFGDGGTSTLQNPGHTYQSAGTYTVALTASNANGSNTLTRNGYITAGSGSTTLTYLAAEDATVKNDSPDTNFGTETDLKVRIGRITYLKFAVSGLTRPVASAKLRLFVNDASPDGGGLYLAASTWSESGITWNNAPAIGGPLIANAGPATLGTWLEIPIGTAVSANGTFSFALKSDTSSDTVYYMSRETANPAQLVITQQP